MIEMVLRKCPNINDCAIVQIDDPIAGALPSAFIVKNNEASITPQSVKQFLLGKN